MLNIGVSYLFLRLRSTRLPLLLVCAAASGGCTLLVGEKLSDKPSEMAGGGGEGGSGGGPTTGSQSSSAAQSSSGSGSLICPKNLANCDGDLMNGCEAHLDADDRNCGKCDYECTDGDLCKGGKCQ
jgi:hypothetical protein